MTKAMTVDFFKPDEKIITQNDEVLDEDGLLLDSTNVYFVMDGNYLVKQMQFDYVQKRKVDEKSGMTASEL